MNKLKLKLDGIGYEYIVIDGVMRGKQGGKTIEHFHLRKQKKNRFKVDFRPWQPETLEIVDGGKLELHCSEVKNGRPSYSLYDLSYDGTDGMVSVKVEFVSYDGTDYMGRDYTLFNEEK
tara:strand:+ start:1846 stop:2202 length:357 start_codon:yes stop_codon:yes gene_type:complete